MRDRLKAVWLVLAIILFCGLRVSAGEDSARLKNLQNLLEIAVDRFDLGKYAQARAALNKLISQNPSAEEAFRLRKLFGAKILLKMQTFGLGMQKQQTMGSAPLELLQRAKNFESLKNRESGYIRSLVEQSTKNVDVAQENMAKISELGAYAVPALLDCLRSKDDKRCYNAHHILQVIGSEAVLPLAEVLKSNDQLLVQQVCSVLGQIRPVAIDALPYLKDVYENQKNSGVTRSIAGEALKNITGQDPAGLPSAAEYYLRMAKRFYLSDPGLEKELERFGGVFWLWDAAAQKGRGALVTVEVPAYMLSDLLAEEMAYRGMELAQNKEAFQILLASILMQEQGKVRTLGKALVRASGAERKRMEAELKLWQSNLKDNLLISYTMGLKNLLAVLSTALADGKDAVAVEALQGIALIGGEAGWSTVSAQPDSVFAALASDNLSVAVAAAQTLAAIGLPQNNAKWNDVVTVLVKGVGQRYTTIAEVVSANKRLADSLVDSLAKGQVMSVAVSSGGAAVAAARNYPPKDVILIDNALNEFSSLHDFMRIRNVRHNKGLPLVIITSKAHVLDIARQFAAGELAAQSKNRHLTEQELVLAPNATFVSAPWNVVIHNDVKVDQKNLLKGILELKKYDVENQPVIILTNPQLKERLALKEKLLLEADSALRPAGGSELTTLKRKDRVLGLRLPSSLPVYLDSEIAGYNAMATVQHLRSDIETKGIPVAILTDPKWLKEVKTEYEFFKKEGTVKVIRSDISHNDLMKTVLALKAKNKASAANYARQLNNEVALTSAEALAAIAGAQGVALSADQIRVLSAGVRNTNSPVELRIAIAGTLGNFRVAQALEVLKSLFKSVDKSQVQFRLALLRAVGEIDRENREIDFKLAAMRENDEAIRKEAAKILGPAARNQADFAKYMNTLRPNNLLKLPKVKDSKVAVK